MNFEIEELILENLLARKAITQKDLKKIINQIKKEDKTLEEVVLACGVKKEVYLTVVAGLFKCEGVDLNVVTVRPELAMLIPKGMAERYQLLSIGKRNNKLVVAMNDPEDVFAKEYVKMCAGFEVVPVFALAQDIIHGIERAYPEILPDRRDAAPSRGVSSHDDATASMTTHANSCQRENIVGHGAKDCVEEHSFRTASQGRFLKWGSPVADSKAGSVSKKDPRVIEISLPSFSQAVSMPNKSQAALNQSITSTDSTSVSAITAPAALVASSAQCMVPTGAGRAEEMLSFLCQFGKELSATLEMEPLLLKVVDVAKHITDAEGGSILLYDSSLNLLYFKWVNGEYGEEIKKVILPLDEHSIAGWVGLHKQPLRIADVTKDPRHCKTIDELIDFKTKSILSVPVEFRGKLLGVMEVVNKVSESEFNQEDEWFLSCLAAQTGVALANAEIVTGLQEYFTQSVELLVSAVDALQPVLKGHITEVARLSAKIAAEYGITGEEYVTIAYAALLHDVGKLQLSAKSLKELEEEHPLVGARILGEMKKFNKAAPYVKYHHERYDGSGYPEGLQGEEIPLGARILGLVDHFSEWKIRREGDGTLEQFLYRFGNQHDPKVIDVLKKVMGQKLLNPV